MELEVNCNERLTVRDCSDDDQIESLRRRVSETLNGNRVSSCFSENGNAEADSGLSTINLGCASGPSSRRSTCTTSQAVSSGLEESWTDDEQDGESDGQTFSLRRRRYVFSFSRIKDNEFFFNQMKFAYIAFLNFIIITYLFYVVAWQGDQ